MKHQQEERLVAASEEPRIHQEALRPFSRLDTARALPRLAAGAAHVALWLGIFSLLDKTVGGGQRFDRIGKFFCRRMTELLGVRVRRVGLERLQRQRSYIFCVNHVSMLDLFVVFQSIPHFHRSFQDASHFDIPLYGGVIRIFGQLPVSRTDKALNRRSFAQASAMIKAGDSFVVFPEGHRTRDGRLGEFYAGAFRLAIATQTEVVPMALKGLRNLSPAGEWRVRPGVVDVIFGEPIASAGLDAETLSLRARAALNALLATGAVV